MLAMLTVAVTMPAALGAKVTSKVLLPPPARLLLAGWLLTLKALLPVTLTRGEPLRVSAPAPTLRMVKVRTTLPPFASILPKFVWSAALGLLSPLALAFCLRVLRRAPLYRH